MQKVAYSNILFKLYYFILTDKSFAYALSSSSSTTVIPSQLLSRLTTVQLPHKIWPQEEHGSTESLSHSPIPVNTTDIIQTVQLAYAKGINQ